MRTSVLLTAMALVAGLGATPLHGQSRIIVAFVPALDTQAVLASGSQLTRMLEVATGFSVEAVVPTSYAATIEALCADRVHVAFLPPFAYVIARERCRGDVRLVSIRSGRPFLRSQILSRSDLDIKNLADLRNRRFAFVDPASTTGYLFPAALIKRTTGLDPAQFFSQVVFAGAHDRVVLAIYQGRVDGGATFADELDARNRVIQQFPDVKERVRVLMYSEPIPNDTVTFSRSLPEETKAKVSRALQRIAETAPGKETLLSLQQIEGFASLEDLRVKYKLKVSSWDDYFQVVRDVAKTLGINLEDLIRPR